MFRKDRFHRIRKSIEAVVGPENVFTSEADILLYSYDSGLDRARPEAVVRFTDSLQVSPVVKILCAGGMPYVARGSGTNLSGGCVPLKGGVILNLAPLSRILEIDTVNNLAVVEPGVCNMALQDELAKTGHFYAPDPASQRVCTIGGNVGENAGGPRCLKYGVTSSHILKLDVVTPEGETVHWSVDDPGPDLVGLMVGSEGTLGTAIRIWVRILPEPQNIATALAAFPDMEPALEAVTGMISSGILPRTLEAMDRVTVEAVEAHMKTGWPADCGAVLLIELDGDRCSVEKETELAEKICRKNSCLSWSLASGKEEREKLWEGRRGAFPAMARLAPNVLVEDGVVPRPRLPEALRRVREIASRYDIKVGLLFHAGDGNLHPNIIFDERNLDETRRVKKAGYEILKTCVALGGSISGEHGIGVGKRVAMSWLYDSAALELFRKVKGAFDPEGLANPDKLNPVETSSGQAVLRPLRGNRSAAADSVIGKVKERFRRGAPSVITGLKTKFPPSAGDYAPGEELPLSGADGILELDRGNCTVTAESGAALISLKKKLSAEGLHLHVPDMPGTLGGLLATRAWTPVRELVLGLDLLLPDGSVVCLGGKVMKNVAGYDLTKLVLGSCGAYGVILSATMRLHARPAGTGRKNAIAPARTFVPGYHHIRLKKVFDPGNLFNPWLFAGENTERR
ncbi:MAG: FAD-linked oxidase C-terminal domain-containing protein [bacterium]